DAGVDAVTTAANVKKLIENGEIFALISGLSAGADKELAAVTRDTETPFLGAATLLTQTSAQENRNLFYLLPGAGQQARALIDFAARNAELKKSRLAIVHAEDELAKAAVASIDDEARKLGWTSVTTISFWRERFDAVAHAVTLKAEGVGAVFFV